MIGTILGDGYPWTFWGLFSAYLMDKCPPNEWPTNTIGVLSSKEFRPYP